MRLNANANARLPCPRPRLPENAAVTASAAAAAHAAVAAAASSEALGGWISWAKQKGGIAEGPAAPKPPPKEVPADEAQLRQVGGGLEPVPCTLDPVSSST
jgi:hypothetical protein